MKKITPFFLLLFTASVIGQTTYNIDDPKDLQNVLYEAGDEIILKNGTYTTDGRAVFMGSGTFNDPIVFKPETPGGVIFTGGLQLNIGGESDDTDQKLATGEFLVVDGFHWKGGYGSSSVIEFRNGYDHASNSTIQNCVMDGLTVDPADQEVGVSEKHNWIQMYGYSNTVINCSFMNKESSGNMILVDLSYNVWAPPYREPEVGEPDNGFESVDTSCNLVGHTISNNYFYNYEKIDSSFENAGDSETIRVGTSSNQNINSGATISNNYFVEADGENEIITNKSKNNSYINNTFRRSRGSLVLRHGSYGTVDGNYFLGENIEGTGGIRIVDSEHTITNNYIQDCINVNDQAQWNNGITFLGGSANNNVPCDSDNNSSDYQKVENINLANNTIINTNAPLFYNLNKGSTDPTGTVSNNLIYFATGNANITDVIKGDTETSYANLGKALTYSGNVYTGTVLGETDADTDNGFSLETGIMTTADGEIFTFSGTGSTGKGADMGAYSPTTDAMVGYGIGACFVNYLGVNITNGDCTIEIPESLIVGSLSPLAYVAGSHDVSVTANVSWTAASNTTWITIDPSAGTSSTIVSLTVTENTDTESRSGSVTFTQDAGGDDIVRVLNVTQDAPPPPDPREGLNLINVLASDVDAVYACHEEIPPNHSKNNPKEHSLDKDPNTQWAGSATSGECVDYVSIIYDLKGAFDLDLVDIATTSGKTYNLQIWVSSTIPASPATYPEAADFTLVYPDSGFFTISTTPDNKVPYTLPTRALGTRYVKIVGDGQPGGSSYTTIHEIEFYGTASSLSTNDFSAENIKLFPNPVTNGVFYLTMQSHDFDKLIIYDISGKAILTKSLKSSLKKEEIDVASISEGLYFVEVTRGSIRSVNKIIISK